VKAVRMRVLGQLANIDSRLSARVAEGLGVRETVPPVKAAAETRTDLPPSPALSLLAKAKPTLKGRMVGVLVAEGADAALVKALIADVQAEGGKVKIVAPTIGGVTGADGALIEADFQLAGGPSVLFDAIAVVTSAVGAAALLEQAAAVAFVHDAFQHLKAIGFTPEARKLLDKAGVKADAAVVELAGHKPGAFVKAARQGKLFEREPMVRVAC
jgi:catalase